MRHSLAIRTQRGLSLIELLITLSIAVILLTIGVPSFVNLMDSSKATTYANDLLADLNYARSEAITRGMRVTVCHSEDASTCSGEWSEGWIVFVNSDMAADVTKVTDSSDILRIHGAVNMASGWDLNANNNFKNFLSYLPTGRSNNIGAFTVCKNGKMNMDSAKAILINRTGRARIATDNDNDGYPDDVDGKKIECIG